MTIRLDDTPPDQPVMFGGETLTGTHQREQGDLDICHIAYLVPFDPPADWFDPDTGLGPFFDPTGNNAGKTWFVTGHETKGVDRHCRRQMADVKMRPRTKMTDVVMCSGEPPPGQPLPGNPLSRGVMFVAQSDRIVGPNDFPLIQGYTYVCMPVQKPWNFEVLFSSN